MSDNFSRHYLQNIYKDNIAKVINSWEIKISKANDIIKENEQVLKGTNKQYIPYLTKDEKELLKSLQ